MEVGDALDQLFQCTEYSVHWHEQIAAPSLLPGATEWFEEEEEEGSRDI